MKNKDAIEFLIFVSFCINRFPKGEDYFIEDDILYRVMCDPFTYNKYLTVYTKNKLKYNIKLTDEEYEIMGLDTKFARFH